MTYHDHTIFFPLGKLDPSFVGEFISRYTEPETGNAAVFWDDDSHTRRRKASLGDGTIEPTPVYDVPVPSELSQRTAEWCAAHLTGHTITLGWPDQFLSDLARSPQPEPELFTGIQLL